MKKGEARPPVAQDAMLLRTYVPPMPLSLFVDYFWYMEDYNPLHAKELALPDGSTDLIIDLGENKIRLFDRCGRELVFGNSIICGPHTDYFVIDTSGESKVIGVHFKPGGIQPFLQVAVDELHNKHLSLNTIWGVKVNGINDELLSSPTPEAMFRILERKLLSLAVKELAPNPALQYALISLQSAKVADIVNQIGVSHRRFNQIFKEEMGMSPKRLSRLLRFQEVLRHMNSGDHISWTDIAMACGYYDQSHFIKDFQAFSGINPGDYRAIQGRHYNHAEFTSV